MFSELNRTPCAFIRTVLLLLLAFAAPSFLQAQDLAPAEKAKIEALLARLESLKDATFIRNGSDYDSRAAAKFLRGKWHAHESEIKTASDFIAKAATVSSTSGKPYVIRFKDGHETPCGDYLSAQFKKLEAVEKAR